MGIDIDGLAEEELVRLNHRIVERLRFLESLHAHGAMLRFDVGRGTDGILVRIGRCEVVYAVSNCRVTARELNPDEL